MRDFRDAKAMAQTLRETLNTKHVSLTHSESLEIVAKILGFHDWNVLAAKIQSVRQNDPAQRGMSSRDTNPLADKPQDIIADVSKPARQEIVVDGAILDNYVGFYQLGDNAVFTVTRDENHLVTRLTGQNALPCYAHSKTEFFAKAVDAQITFVLDAKGQAKTLILHQGGGNIPMERINATTAEEIERKTTEKIKNQTATSGAEEALRRLVDGLISGKPNYDEMSTHLAEATRHQLPNLHSGLAELGAVQSVKFLGVGAQGSDAYIVWHDNGASHWQIALDSKGMISTALVRPGP